MQAHLVDFVSAGEAVGVVSISIDEKSGAGDLQSSSYWNLVRQSLKQGPMSSWPAVENKTYSLLRPRKAVCSLYHEIRTTGSLHELYLCILSIKFILTPTQ